MSIAHELSCDVAAAMLAGSGTHQQASQAQTHLTEIVLEVHTTLRSLNRESRLERLDSRLRPESRAAAGHAPGGH
jgi:hypothetical protein